METAVAAHAHWWLIESPQPGKVELSAHCRFCDAERTFPAEAQTWRDEWAERRLLLKEELCLVC